MDEHEPHKQSPPYDLSQVKAIRNEQLRQRREAAACSVEREKAHWERGREQWVRENRREEEEGEGRRKVSQGSRGLENQSHI